MPEVLRKQLGDYSSIVCLKAIIVGMEDALGKKATAIALTAAGRNHGKKLVPGCCLGSIRVISW